MQRINNRENHNQKSNNDREIMWLAKTAWNLGVSTAMKTHFKTSSIFFSNAFHLFQMVQNVPGMQKQMLLCLIMSANAKIEVSLYANRL